MGLVDEPEEGDADGDLPGLAEGDALGLAEGEADGEALGLAYGEERRTDILIGSWQKAMPIEGF